MCRKRKLSRRDVLRMGAATALAVGSWPGALHAVDTSAGPFRFLCVNDLHCMDDESAVWLESRVIAAMKQTQDIDFCLVLGDLAEKGTQKELGAVRDLFAALKLPVHAVPGNHDYVSANSRQPYDELFPKALNYSVDHKGWQFIGLDTTQGTASKDTTVQAATLSWIDETLPKLDKQKPMVVFTHFPMGQKVTFRPKNADDVLMRFVDHNLKAVFSGHYHAGSEREHRGAMLTTSPCCALKRNNHDKSPQKGFFVCQTKDGKLTREFVQVSPPV